MLESRFNEVAVLGDCNFIKEDSDTGGFLQNFLSISKLFLKKDPNIGDPNIFVNFVKFLRKIIFRTSPSSDFSHDVVFSFLQISEVCNLKSICLVIHKPIQSGVVMEIR